MQIKRHIPNILTLLNLFCGCIAIIFISVNTYEMAFIFVCLGIFFDFFDGFFARKWGVSGPLGVQLDSLADMVTSGVAPGFVMYKLLMNNKNLYVEHLEWQDSMLPFLGFIITLGACYRLANFNIDTRQTDSFIGLPTPANTLFIMSLPLVADYFHEVIDLAFEFNSWVLIAITFLSAYIMNAEVPLFSLKIKEFTFQKYKLQIGFLLTSLILLLFLKIIAVPLIILMYIFLSIVNNTILQKK